MRLRNDRGMKRRTCLLGKGDIGSIGWIKSD